MSPVWYPYMRGSCHDTHHYSQDVPGPEGSRNRLDLRGAFLMCSTMKERPEQCQALHERKKLDQ